VQYADTQTRILLQNQKEETIIIIPKERWPSAGAYIEQIEELGFCVIDILTIQLEKDEDIERVCSFWTQTERQILSNNNNRSILCVVLSGRNSIKTVYNLMKNNSIKEDENPLGIICPSNLQEFQSYYEFFNRTKFSSSSATYSSHSTLCVIKSHIIKSHQVGSLMNYIIGHNFDITAIKSCNLDRSQAIEFLQVYEGICKEYRHFVDTLSSGPCIAMEVTEKRNNNSYEAENEDNIVVKFRKCAGPWNVDMAKELFPDSIRGVYGINNIENAIHCTDLKEDATSEIQYFFQVI